MNSRGHDKRPLYILDDIRSIVAHVRIYLVALVRWLVCASIIGVLSGLLGAAFHLGVELATEFRYDHVWIVGFLPLAGIVIVAIYRVLHVEGLTTDTVIDQVRTGEGLRVRLLPAIFASTIVTHLVGGSAGREGAALQMGGTVGLGIARLLRLDERDMRTATMAGMAAFFAALFGTPVAATIFAMGVISVGAIYHVSFVPCLIASLVSYGVSLMLGIEPMRLALSVPEVGPLTLAAVAILGGLCGVLSAVFCEALHRTEHIFSSRLPNPWIRTCVGGCILLVLTLIVGNSDYNGTGIGVIVRAVEGGEAFPAAFALKMLFTSVTLASGFKGGEVIPSFFIGSTFGCVVGPLLGLPAPFCAGIGLVSVFCGAVNCPIASIVLALEFFGAEGLLFYAVACGFAFVLSGYYSLYYSQRILYDKLKATFIDAHANAYHEKDPSQSASMESGD